MAHEWDKQEMKWERKMDRQRDRAWEHQTVRGKEGNRVERGIERMWAKLSMRLSWCVSCWSSYLKSVRHPTYFTNTCCSVWDKDGAALSLFLVMFYLCWHPLSLGLFFTSMVSFHTSSYQEFSSITSLCMVLHLFLVALWPFVIAFAPLWLLCVSQSFFVSVFLCFFVVILLVFVAVFNPYVFIPSLYCYLSFLGHFASLCGCFFSLCWHFLSFFVFVVVLHFFVAVFIIVDFFVDVSLHGYFSSLRTRLFISLCHLMTVCGHLASLWVCCVSLHGHLACLCSPLCVYGFILSLLVIVWSLFVVVLRQ